MSIQKGALSSEEGISLERPLLAALERYGLRHSTSEEFAHQQAWRLFNQR